MINEEEVRNIVNEVLKEEHLHNFIKIFEKEHNLFRGSHDKIGLPEAVVIPQAIVTQIVEKFETQLTEGSIPFIDENGHFTEDLDHFFYEKINRKAYIRAKEADTSNLWGMANSAIGGATRLEIVDADSEKVNDNPLIWIERKHDGLYTGEDPSVPVCLYAQHIQEGSGTAFTHTIMALAVNNGTGNNDVIASSGRAIRNSGIGDSCGVWGSAYNNVNNNGGVMGMEAVIYQNIAGMPAGDNLGSKWSVGLHVLSASTGSDARAGIAIDGIGAKPYRFWNAILIDGNAFRSGAPAGTVGLNMANANPQYGIKFGSATRHIYGTGNINLQCPILNIYGAVTISTTLGVTELATFADHMQFSFDDARIAFMGSTGGIGYKDTGAIERWALYFPGSNQVVLCNRAANGTVYIKANSAVAGGDGEVLAGTFEDDLISFHVAFALPSIKSGADQGAAGAVANELWKTSGHTSLPDNVVMIGV